MSAAVHAEERKNPVRIVPLTADHMSFPTIKKPIASVITPEVLDRFERYYKKRPGICWEWVGGRNNKGYGMFYINKKNYLAHRISYALAKGDPEETLVIDHLCSNPPCINPEHLEAVSHSENVLRGKNPAARNRRKTHCQYGHPFEGDNIVRQDKRWNARSCKICNANIKRRSWERHKLRGNGNIPTIEEFDKRWLKEAYQLPDAARQHITEYITQLLINNHE